jgi:hypothetical protein
MGMSCPIAFRPPLQFPVQGRAESTPISSSAGA